MYFDLFELSILLCNFFSTQIIDFRQANYEKPLEMHDKCLISLGFEVSSNEVCVFSKQITNHTMAVSYYACVGGSSIGKTQVSTHPK